MDLRYDIPPPVLSKFDSLAIIHHKPLHHLQAISDSAQALKFGLKFELSAVLAAAVIPHKIMALLTGRTRLTLLGSKPNFWVRTVQIGWFASAPKSEELNLPTFLFPKLGVPSRRL